LSIALLNVSNPTLGAMDALSRLSHDTDAEVAQNAVVALGETQCHSSTIALHSVYDTAFKFTVNNDGSK
jgi:hypothetical protein